MFDSKEKLTAEARHGDICISTDIECSFCMGKYEYRRELPTIFPRNENPADYIATDAAEGAYSKGWRYISSNSMGQEGIACKECVNNWED